MLLPASTTSSVQMPWYGTKLVSLNTYEQLFGKNFLKKIHVLKHDDSMTVFTTGRISNSKVKLQVVF